MYFLSLLQVCHGCIGVSHLRTQADCRLSFCKCFHNCQGRNRGCGWTKHWLFKLLPAGLLHFHSHFIGSKSHGKRHAQLWGVWLSPVMWLKHWIWISHSAAAHIPVRNAWLFSFFLYSWCLWYLCLCPCLCYFPSENGGQDMSFCVTRGTEIDPVLVPWLTSTSAVPRSSTLKFHIIK